MRQQIRAGALLGFVVTVLIAASPRSQSEPSGGATPLSVRGGSVAFEVATNLFGTTVRGKSTALEAGTDVRVGASGLLLEHLEASVPVTSLKTGIALRDRHMLEQIFQTGDGELPDVRFAADGAECSRAAGDAYACVASGLLTIRNTPRPFAMTIEVTREGSGYRASGSGRIALSAYGIARPSQLGVRTEDEVRIRVEFTARAAATAGMRRR
jgi:polyisoprenoid-binding protein YceI